MSDKTYASHAEVMARQNELDSPLTLKSWAESVCLPDLRSDEEKALAPKCWWGGCDEPVLIGIDFCQYHRAQDFKRMIDSAFMQD